MIRAPNGATYLKPEVVLELLPGFQFQYMKVETTQLHDDKVFDVMPERGGSNSVSEKGVERCSWKFSRRFRIPKNAKVDQIKAFMENGVLRVTVPKVEAKKPDVKAIEISG